MFVAFWVAMGAATELFLLRDSRVLNTARLAALWLAAHAVFWGLRWVNIITGSGVGAGDGIEPSWWSNYGRGTVIGALISISFLARLRRKLNGYPRLAWALGRRRVAE